MQHPSTMTSVHASISSFNKLLCPAEAASEHHTANDTSSLGRDVRRKTCIFTAPSTLASY